MGSVNDTENWKTFYRKNNMGEETYHQGDKVSYNLNDNIIRTGTVISTGYFIKIKEFITNLTHFATINKVRNLRFKFNYLHIQNNVNTFLFI